MVDIEVVAGVADWSLRSTAIYKYLHTVLPADEHGFCLFSGLMSTLQQQLWVQVFGNVKIPGPLWDGNLIVSSGACVSQVGLGVDR